MKIIIASSLKYGIENMDYKCLAQDLIKNEPQLFSARSYKIHK